MLEQGVWCPGPHKKFWEFNYLLIETLGKF